MTAQGFWTWRDTARCGPERRFRTSCGWWAVGAGLVWAFGKIAPELFGQEQRPQTLTSSFALAYLIEAAFLPFGLLLLGLPVAALFTALAMGAAVWAVFRSGAARPHARARDQGA